MNESRCPHCGGSLAADCLYCAHCGRRARNYQHCPSCGEPSAEGARYCPSCARKIPTPRDQKAQELHLEFRATRLGAFFTTGSITAFFLPPEITVSDGRIKVRKWSLFGLRQHDQEIQVTRVASVRYTKGVFWGGILVETFGGATEDLSERGLRQEDALQLAEQLKAVVSG